MNAISRISANATTPPSANWTKIGHRMNFRHSRTREMLAENCSNENITIAVGTSK